MKKNSDYRILVVDDIPANVELVCNILDEMDYDLYIANNGLEALNQIANISFDLILLDVMMPALDGFSVAKMIKKQQKNKDIPIIFLTAKTDTNSVINGFDAGGVDYITKPFNKKELLVRVETHLKLKHSNDLIQQQIKTLNQQKLELNESNQLKDTIFSIIGHDLRGLVGTNMQLSDLLMSFDDEDDIEDINDIAHRIYSNSESTMTLLDNLLQWGKSKTRKLQYSPKRFDLSNIIPRILDTLQSGISNKKIHVLSLIKQGSYIFGDINMIETIIRNLVSNAIKYVNIGGDISLNLMNESESQVIEIQDNGMGMTDDIKNKLFSVDSSIIRKGTNNEKGTGLGLLVCKEMVDLHGGTLSVLSEVDQGTTFLIRLPLVSVE